MAILTYWLGIEGFSRRNKVAFKTVEVLSEKEEKHLDGIAKKIQDVMLEKELFKNPALTVALLSEEIDEKPYLVTKALTNRLNTKFNDFVNFHRFEALKQLLLDNKNDKFTLLSLAFEAGFNSKASFNRTVKKLTGKSPKHLKSNI